MILVARRIYSEEEKKRVIGLVVATGHSVAAVAAELGLAAPTLRRWVRKHRQDARERAWAEQVERHFGFLDRYGFMLTSVDASTWWEVRATYQSKYSALAVICSNEFRRVEVQLMRLVAGELPEYPIFVVDSAPVDTFYADDLVALRQANADQGLVRQRGLSDEDVEAQLAFWAAAIREHGQDFLHGDLRVLDTLERIVRDRARQHPPGVVVWVPDSTSTVDQERTVELVRAKTPEGVTVTARRYRRTRRP